MNLHPTIQKMLRDRATDDVANLRSRAGSICNDLGEDAAEFYLAAQRSEMARLREMFS